MNKLWVYGCSFSMPYNLDTEIYWGTHLSEKLNLECITKSYGGEGWNYINNRIDEDILKWSKNDIIIISPSFFTRVSIEEFKSINLENYIHLLKDNDKLDIFNKSRWKQKVKTLQHFGYNVYTWIIFGYDSNNDCDIKNLIDVDGIYDFEIWMKTNEKYSIEPKKDWHLNELGHIELSNIFYKFIKKD